MRLIRLLAVFGIGYVLGSRAGRQRYEEIRDLANRFGEDPRVQEAAGRAQGLVKEAVDTASDRDDRSAGSWPEHPDAHVEVPQDEVVYTSGPDLR